jgi:molybdopterin molybdotransferase
MSGRWPTSSWAISAEEILVAADQTADWLSVGAARAAILRQVAPLDTVRCSLQDALGRILAEEIRAPLDLPPWDNSAMDGFAVRSADIAAASAASPVALRVVDDVPAGGFPSRPIGAGDACRIMTGAPVPEGADSVVRVEHTDGGSRIGTPAGRVRVFARDDAGRNIRKRGEDLRRDEPVLQAGLRLRPAEIGMAASIGRAELPTVRPPRVAVLASGDELVDIDAFAEVLAGRRIVSSNSYSLAAQMRETGADVLDLGIARDDLDDITARLEAARSCDALVTTAGISVGEHDHMRAALERFGVTVAFWRVKMRPGSPLAFGRVAALGGIPWFGLPGNPVSSMVTCEVFVRPALLRMAGHTAIFPPTAFVGFEGDQPTVPGLTNFPRARLERQPDGSLRATLTGSQGSGILSSMVAADALLVVPDSVSDRPRADRLVAILLGGAPLQTQPGF